MGLGLRNCHGGKCRYSHRKIHRNIKRCYVSVMPRRVRHIDRICLAIQVFMKRQRVFLIALEGIHRDTGDEYDFFQRSPGVVRGPARPRVRVRVGRGKPAQDNG